MMSVSTTLNRIDVASGKKNVTGPRRMVKSPGSRNNGTPPMIANPITISTAPPTTSHFPIEPGAYSTSSTPAKK
jgi:hypothetical protein